MQTYSNWTQLEEEWEEEEEAEEEVEEVEEEEAEEEEEEEAEEEEEEAEEEEAEEEEEEEVITGVDLFFYSFKGRQNYCNLHLHALGFLFMKILKCETISYPLWVVHL